MQFMGRWIQEGTQTALKEHCEWISVWYSKNSCEDKSVKLNYLNCMI